MEFSHFLREMLDISTNFEIIQVEKIKTSEKIIRIYLKYVETTCKVLGEYYDIYDYAPEREWQHLNWFEYKCYIVCRLPRYKTHEGKVKTYKPAFSDPGKSYTNLFRQAALDLLRQIKVQSQVAKILKTSSYIIRSIMEEAVEYGLSKRGEIKNLKNISIDEKAYARGHEYATILMDSDKEYILEMQEGRDEKSLKTLFYMVTGEEEQPHLNIVNIDMWRPYMNVIEQIAPQATIVHDKFHIIKKLTESINATRKKEVKENDLLIRQKYNVLKNTESRNSIQQKQFDAISSANLKTAEAWHIRENFKLLWNYISIDIKNAVKQIQVWIEQSRNKGIHYVNKTLKTIENHIEGVAAAIATKTSSALHENINGKIQSVIAKARGFRNFERFRINALFYYGNLNFYH